MSHSSRLAFAFAVPSLALMLAGTLPAMAADVAFFPLPSGAYPHDVAPAPDGTVWYSDQPHGRLGRFDPRSGKVVDQVPLGAHSAPHGVIIGPDGAAWVTDGGQNAIVRVDPASRAVKVFPLPGGFPRANLNTAAFAPDGMLWFTGQSGVYGRVDPASGKVDAWRAPKGRGPYGITATTSGVWYASLAGDHIARVDPTSGAAEVVEPPRPGVGPRRIWADSQGLLWVSFWEAGELGRYDPASKAWKTWPMPTGKAACYAVYVDSKDQVWLSDWVANALVRFDPTSESFVSFPSDRDGADVRQIAGRPGEVWGGQSGLSRLVVVRD